MVVVPAGSFMMGSPASEAGRLDDEGPQHRVTVAKPFAVGKFEVTVAEWDACVAGGGCNHKPSDQGWGRGRRPVINVSWQDAKGYVAWLSRKTGRTYRLLSEAEWEYAARAGTTTPFSTGATISTDQANFGGNGGSAKEVGSFKANAFGLHDMHGNVWEWVEDCWNGSYSGAPTDGSVWTSGDCTSRVLRGGSWYGNPRLLRSANRDRFTTDFRNYGFGFRVGRTLTP
jgi:formylglycine-generating enzyme required for sulfatase activity